MYKYFVLQSTFKTKIMSTIKETKEWIANSITIKLLIIGFIILMLLIPVQMIKNLITERESLRENVEEEIFSKWGNSQTVAGPILSIPYYWYSKDDEKTIRHMSLVHFLPDELFVTGEVGTEVRYRGIYETIVYQASLNIHGTIPHPDFSAWKIENKDILWDEAFLSLGIPDMRGIKPGASVLINGRQVLIKPGLQNLGMLQSGIRTDFPLEEESLSTGYPFEIKLNLNGSGSLNFVPSGKTTRITLNSEWTEPSFTGAFLPESRNITEEGFSAEWKILDLNRNYPQQWKDEDYGFDGSEFGVYFLLPVDQYQKTYRSVKYAIMFLSLTFLIFLFVEILGYIRIHPIQYLLVGLALLIFYVLLLSLSEQINLNLAYLFSSLAIVIMISSYARAIFKNWKQTLITALCLIALYTFLFTVLQLQDYALLLGSIGLFIALGVTMYLSRNINWYKSYKKKDNVRSTES